MPEYDAFGREIGENTLSGLGGGSDATVRPAPDESDRPEPSPVAAPGGAPSGGWTDTPVTAPPPPRRRTRQRSGRPLGCLVGLVILAAVVAGPVIAIVSFVGSASDTIDDFTGTLDDIPTIDPGDAPEAPPDAPTGITGRSMLAPASVARVRKALRNDGAKSVVRVTIWPDRLEAEAVRGQRARDIEYRFDGGVERGDATPVNRASGTVPLADIDPRAPARLVRNAAARFRLRERRIGYLILSPDVLSGSGHRWVAYFRNGRIIEGDGRGRVVRRIS